MNESSLPFHNADFESAHLSQYGRLTCNIVNVPRIANDTCSVEEEREDARNRRERRGVGVDPDARRGKQRAGR